MASLKKRGKTYYAQYSIGGQVRRISLKTTSIQVAKEKVRNLESAMLRQDDIPIPTRTPVAEIVAAYVEHMKTAKTANGFKVDCWYLRQAFGPVCPALARGDEQCKGFHLRAAHFEDISTAQVAEFITRLVRDRKYSPKTANRFREVMQRVFSWAISQRGIRTPGGRNPVSQVERYKVPAGVIRYLTLEQIGAHLAALENMPQLRAMVAMYIYAGLRREEALWLTVEDVSWNGEGGIIQIRSKEVNGHSWTSKTKVNRSVPISSKLRPILEQYRRVTAPALWFFPSPQGTRWDPDNFSHALDRANSAAGLPWTCLDYRHTFGSHLAMKGESLYKIATLMGNSPDICRRHYATLCPTSLVASVEF